MTSRITTNAVNCKKEYITILFLTLLTILPYAQVAQHSFVHLDDYEYIVNNAYINKGLSAEGFHWAMNFRLQDESYWRPLTWISHMLDYTLFGNDAGMHHLINIFLHVSNTILVYLLLYKMTGRLLESFIVAVFFGLHPINVESVAWLTERSNVLSMFWGLICLILYYKYAIKKTRFHYWLMIFSYIFSLMAKPLLVTLPFLMLLLDYWPIGRIRKLKEDPKYLAKIVIEKLPLIILSFLAILISINRVGITISVAQVPISLRASNALVSYVQYILAIINPTNLAAFYPFPQSIPVWKTIGAIIVIAVTTVVAFIKVKKMPYFFVGWFWYIGTLLPKVGFIQAGLWPAMADRWAYFPAIGLFIIMAWMLFSNDAICQKSYRHLFVVAMTAVVGIMTFQTWNQVSVWNNSYSLFEHMARKTQNNFLAYNNLGYLYSLEGETEVAEKYFYKAITINPKYEKAYFNLGVISLDKGI